MQFIVVSQVNKIQYSGKFYQFRYRMELPTGIEPVLATYQAAFLPLKDGSLIELFV